MCHRCLLHHILSLIAYAFRENRDFVFIIIAQFMMSANSRIQFGLQTVFMCLYITPSDYHHLQTYLKTMNLKNACQIYFVECVSKIEHILSVIHYTIYGTVCFQFNHSLVMIERIYILSYYHHQIESMIIVHCLGLGHETMVCAAFLSIFFIHDYLSVIVWLCFSSDVKLACM